MWVSSRLSPRCWPHASPPGSLLTVLSSTRYPQAGPAFVRYRRLHGRRSMAESVLVTCPEADWPPAGVAPKGPGPAPAGPNASAPALSSPPGFLQPCGTAVVTDGSQLLAAVEALQAVAQRVLVTLDANITLPCTPTEQVGGGVGRGVQVLEESGGTSQAVGQQNDVRFVGVYLASHPARPARPVYELSPRLSCH